MSSRALVVVLVVASLLASSAAGVAAAHPPEHDAADRSAAAAAANSAEGSHARTTTAADTPTIDKHVEVYLTPDRAGYVDVVVTYDVPDVLTSMQVRLPADATDVRTDSFSESSYATYSWDGETDPARIRFTIAANRTTAGSRSMPAVDAGSSAAAGDQYSFVDVGPWALVTVPQLGTQWGWRGAPDVTLSQRVTVAGEGSTGGEIAYLGDVETYSRTAGGQNFTLVVPDRATLAGSPDEILRALGTASEALRVGARDPEVWMVAAPTSVPWGVRGVEYGGTDSWVEASARLDDPGNVWFHEYVHTRQAFTTLGSGRWTTEATAEYYAAYLSLEADLVSFRSFQRYLGHGERDPWADAVLADPATWTSGANYVKGSLVWGAVDRRVRLATDSSHTMADVLWALNRQDDPVTNEDILDAVASTANDDVAAYAHRYTAASDAPEMWSQLEHVRAFNTDPPRMNYSLDDYRVTGPYRTTSFASSPTLYVGETLHVSGAVTNEGGADGTFLATLDAGDRTLDTETGTLAPTESSPFGLTYEFTESGTYNLTVGRNTVPVEVLEPADVAVTDLSASPTSVGAGEDVTVSVTFSNPGDTPAGGTVPVTLDGHQVASVDVALGAGASVTRTVTVTIPDAGEHVVDVGERSVRINAGSGSGMPGFTLPAALVALALAALVVGRRR